MASVHRIALVQMLVGASKEANLEKARRLVLEAAHKGAGMVVLPGTDQLVLFFNVDQECFNSPYGTSFFPTYAEPLGTGPSSLALSKIAKDAGVFLIGGSFPEVVSSGKEAPRFYNTCTIWDPAGSLIDHHRKVHLFDIDIPGKQTFKESEVLSPGDKLTTFSGGVFGTVGVGICYDMRFPEVAMCAAREEGVKLMVYPGAFNMTTGPLHVSLLQLFFIILFFVF